MDSPPCHSYGDLTSLTPHERLPELPVVPCEKPHTGMLARVRDSASGACEMTGAAGGPEGNADCALPPLEACPGLQIPKGLPQPLTHSHLFPIHPSPQNTLSSAALVLFLLLSRPYTNHSLQASSASPNTLASPGSNPSPALIPSPLPPRTPHLSDVPPNNLTLILPHITRVPPRPPLQ